MDESDFEVVTDLQQPNNCRNCRMLLRQRRYRDAKPTDISHVQVRRSGSASQSLHYGDGLWCIQDKSQKIRTDSTRIDAEKHHSLPHAHQSSGWDDARDPKNPTFSAVDDVAGPRR